MSSYDWSEFKIVFYYEAPVESVFRCFATGAGLESFFLSSARIIPNDRNEPRSGNVVAQDGDRYEWTWLHGHTLDGWFRRVSEPGSVAFSFGGMEVVVELTDVGGQCELVLLQSGIELSDEGRMSGHLNCRSCWIFFLTNLKSVLEQKADLRDSDPARTSSMEVGFAELSGK